jgi:hypothetical protein
VNIIAASLRVPSGKKPFHGSGIVEDKNQADSE